VTEYSLVVVGKGNTLGAAVVSLDLQYFVEKSRFMAKQIFVQDALRPFGTDIDNDHRARNNHTAK